MNTYLSRQKQSLLELRDELLELMRITTLPEDVWGIYCRLIAVEREIRRIRT